MCDVIKRPYRDGSQWDGSWWDGLWRDGSWRDGSPSNKSSIPRKSASETSQCGKRVASVTWKTAQDHVNNLHNQTNSTDSLGTLALVTRSYSAARSYACIATPFTMR